MPLIGWVEGERGLKIDGVGVYFDTTANANLFDMWVDIKEVLSIVAIPGISFLDGSKSVGDSSISHQHTRLH